MKIILKTTFLVAVLATGVLGINNVFAQQDDDSEMMMEGNDTGSDGGMTMNATLPMSIIGDNDTSKPDASKPMKP